jgi:3-oxoadipate enol-lactonase
MPFVPLPDVRLCYARCGFGPPLLCLPGSGSDLRNRPNMLDWSLHLDFDVVSYDHRGLGRSDPADPGCRPSMADFGSDALRLVDHLGWSRFRVFGVSFGGMVAQELAICAGQRVERLVLACTSAGGKGGSSYPLHELYALSHDERIERQVAVLDTRTQHDPRLAEELKQWFPEKAVTPGMERQLEARRGHDTWERLSCISAPTLVAAGRYDGIAPLPNSEALARRIPDATLEVFEGGHAFFAQDPRALPAIVEFLKMPS